ncbi:aryl-sulfate sulfotransferase [Haloarchaeobius sp. HME9146]|uniref:aryl-sulfate sulfotransferase n=1 Tax=Haloarchaeobius sp. HME9146 TaxID=2978732 RepID=UPI0021C0231C|nr:aryl-sulfate sulfotransferase [Haloarchaeobius sp. HME9146]MCT9094446.1 aryl-sulfate sulfotransferase [Haloarchaeobius sp. HME9146]
MERRSRMLAVSALLLLVTAYLGLQAAFGAPAAAATPMATEQNTTNETASVLEQHAGNTLIGIQSYGDAYEGRAIEVTPNGEVIWEYEPDNSRVFDVEMLENGNILASVATKRPSSACPEEFAEGGCVHNRVVELDYETKEEVWNHSWYDVFVHNHEVHDADRLPNGETAIIDMGNNRAFTVDQQGDITWEWHAREHLGEGTEFDQQYDSPEYTGPEKDWTHMNDIDLLQNGNFQMSIRNFDVVIEVNRTTKDVVSVVGTPGEHDQLYEQHNPMRLNGTVLVADSENDRVVEYDVESGEKVWEYSQGILWPRDADRLENGNTLIVDTFNNRVIELNTEGEVVWQYGGIQMPYAADRLGGPEEGGVDATGENLTSKVEGDGVEKQVGTYVAWARFVFPGWVSFEEFAAATLGAVLSLVLVFDLALFGVARLR